MCSTATTSARTWGCLIDGLLVRADGKPISPEDAKGVAAHEESTRTTTGENVMPSPQVARPSVRLLLVVVFALTFLVASPVPTRAVEVPPQGLQTYTQTNGPVAGLGQGDWYTGNTNGVGVGYHYFGVNVPCGWPANLPVMIDLFSPEMNAFNKSGDEIKIGQPANTAYELYLPGTKIGPQPNIPAPNTGIAGSLKVYAPVGYGIQKPPAERWDRFYTLTAPVQCGTYVVRSEADAADQNSWRLRIGYDNDNDPTNNDPPNSGVVDNPDGLAGTGDELTISVTQTSYQHNVTAQNVGQCLTLYQYVDPVLTETFFHNFDMDAGLARSVVKRVRYYSPSATLDPLALTGGIVGTPSGTTVWDNITPGANASVARGTGDRIVNPESGWWRIVTCINDDNQYIQEGQTGVPSFFAQPPTPVLAVSKDDGRTTTLPNAEQTYTINFTNTSNLTPTPGAATNVVLTDALPSNTTYVGCSIDAPFTGTCAQNGGSVVYQLDGLVVAGAHGSVKLTVKVNADATGSITNSVTITGKDMLGNNVPPASDTDIDTIPSADLSLNKTIDKQAARVGDSIVFTITISNAGPDTATNVAASDKWPSGLQFVSAQASQGGYDNTTGIWTVGTLANGATATLRIAATVLPSGALVNTAQISKSDQPDPDSEPNNDDPFEDDQASAGPNGPTAIALERFSATREVGGVNVSWKTVAEQNAWVFHLLRSTDGAHAHAVRVTDAPIKAQGRGTGASYSWTDRTTDAAQSYTYWLQEIDLDGTIHEYGPTQVGATTTARSRYILLPVVVKR